MMQFVFAAFAVPQQNIFYCTKTDVARFQQVFVF